MKQRLSVIGLTAPLFLLAGCVENQNDARPTAEVFSGSFLVPNVGSTDLFFSVFTDSEGGVSEGEVVLDLPGTAYDDYIYYWLEGPADDRTLSGHSAHLC